MSTKDLQSKHWAGKKMNVIQSYWDSPPATKRSKWLANQLKQYDFDSIFEVGFFAGRNLRYIKEAFPGVKVGGLEINKLAVEFAKEKLKLNDLHHMNLHDLGKLNTKYDIVFTSGVLIHVPPNDIRSAVEKMVRVSSRYVMHLEQLGSDHVTAGPKNMRPSYKVSDQIQWAPDLVKAYRDLGFGGDNITIVPLPDDCKTNGAAELLIVGLR